MECLHSLLPHPRHHDGAHPPSRPHTAGGMGGPVAHAQAVHLLGKIPAGAVLRGLGGDQAGFSCAAQLVRCVRSILRLGIHNSHQKVARVADEDRHASGPGNRVGQAAPRIHAAGKGAHSEAIHRGSVHRESGVRAGLQSQVTLTARHGGDNISNMLRVPADVGIERRPSHELVGHLLALLDIVRTAVHGKSPCLPGSSADGSCKGSQYFHDRGRKQQ
mmetsp:Transcript_80/g.196  ORF Transcript_80/g.196 Transcript_80/m.196 type:complete len:218 (+) Transcript_80:621-1274(+)